MPMQLPIIDAWTTSSLLFFTSVPVSFLFFDSLADFGLLATLEYSDLLFGLASNGHCKRPVSSEINHLQV